MLTKALIELIIILWDLTPLIFAIKPNPQLSLNSSFFINPGIFRSIFVDYITKLIDLIIKSVILCHTHCTI